MAVIIKANTKRVRKMAKDSLHGLTGPTIRVSGSTTRCMAPGASGGRTVGLTKGSTSTIGNMGGASSQTLTADAERPSGKTGSRFE
jgi:hypothetical protein